MHLQNLILHVWFWSSMLSYVQAVQSECDFKKNVWVFFDFNCQQYYYILCETPHISDWPAVCLLSLSPGPKRATLQAMLANLENDENIPSLQSNNAPASRTGNNNVADLDDTGSCLSDMLFWHPMLFWRPVQYTEDRSWASPLSKCVRGGGDLDNFFLTKILPLIWWRHDVRRGYFSPAKARIRDAVKDIVSDVTVVNYRSWTLWLAGCHYVVSV